LPCRSSLFLSTEFSSCFSLYLLRSWMACKEEERSSKWELKGE
jgi:hypothetical protein